MVQPRSLIGMTKETDWSVTQEIKKLTLERGDLITDTKTLQKYFLPSGLNTSLLGKKIYPIYIIHTTNGVYSTGNRIEFYLRVVLKEAPMKYTINIEKNNKVKKAALFIIIKAVE